LNKGTLLSPGQSVPTRARGPIGQWLVRSPQESFIHGKPRDRQPRRFPTGMTGPEMGRDDGPRQHGRTRITHRNERSCTRASNTANSTAIVARQQKALRDWEDSDT
jgi:hypothetical protein